MAIGQSEPAFSHQGELDHYCELLSAANITFDIIGEDDITEGTFADKDLIRYVAAIVTVPFSLFSDESFRRINEASRNFGISVISSFNHVDARSQEMFGIRSLGRMRPLWPLRTKILNWPHRACQESVIVNYGLLAGVPGIRSRGLKKLSWKQTAKKAVKIVRSLFFPYVKVELKPEARVIATDMKGKPLVWSNKFGRAINYYFAMHGGLFLGKFNEIHRLVRSLIEANSGFGMVSVSLENAMALRLDDPGACCADYLDKGGVLLANDWKELGDVLKSKGIPLSVVYTPGWVDDGDRRSGSLCIEGRELVERKAGSLYSSAQVRYLPASNKYGAYDHASEFEGLRRLAQEGLAEIHSHGLTHLDPDHQSWARAKDRLRDTRWYHEFYHVRNRRPVERREQSYALSVSRDKIHDSFGSYPLAFTPSGHKHGPDSDLLSFDAGYLLFSADYTGFLKKNLIIRNWKIRSLFLYLKEASLFADRSGYPFIGVVHDYEVKNDFNHLNDIIEKWRSVGIRRFLSINDLVTSLGSTVEASVQLETGTLDIDLHLPTARISGGPFRELSGRELCLKINLPDKMIPLVTEMRVLGGTLLSSDSDVHNAVMTILIKSSGSAAIRIDIPFAKGE
jgi:hypothetical protein